VEQSSFSDPAAPNAAHDSGESTGPEAHLGNSFKTAPTVMFIKDREGRYLSINAAGALSLRLEPNEIIGRTLEELVPAEQADRLGSGDRSILENGESVEFEEAVLHDGQTRVYRIFKSPLRNPEGGIIGVVGVSHDVTDYQRAERAHRILVRAGAILDASLDLNSILNEIAKLFVPEMADWCGIDLVEEDGTITLAAVVHSDPKKAEFGRELRERFPPNPSESKGIRRALVTGEPEYYENIDDTLLKQRAINAEHFQLLKKLGMRSALVVPMLAGTRPVGALTLVNAESARPLEKADLPLAQEVANRAARVIEHVRLYARLSRSESRYRAILQSARDAIFVYPVAEDGTPGRFLEVNDEACRRLGYTRSELLHKTVIDLVDMPSARVVEGIRQLIEDGQALRDATHLTKDGRPIPVQVNATRLDIDGQPHVLSIIRDMTERIENERALRDMSAGLEQQVRERTQRLERQTVQLRRFATELSFAEQRERRRLAQVLHDHLQQLLVAAQMRLGALRGKSKDENARTAVREVESLIEQAIREARTLTVELRPPVLYEDGLIAALRWLAKHMESQHGLRVHVDAPDSISGLGPDYLPLLFECVRELLFNVVKYANVEETFVRVENTEENLLVLCVEDKGAGFTSPESTLAGAPDRGGFGLFSVQERIMAMGGEVEIESAQGHGTCVSLRVPLWLSEPKAAEDSMELTKADPHEQMTLREEGPAATVTVLLVDDHRIVREGIASVLDEDPRLKIIGQATNGEEAVSMAITLRPHVVVMDINLPRLNGIEATRLIRQRCPEIEVIGLSVHDEDTVAESMTAAGAAGYFCKSDDPRLLTESIVALAESRGEMDEVPGLGRQKTVRQSAPSRP
jgi:PAS domain S-box-containing protein